MECIYRDDRDLLVQVALRTAGHTTALMHAGTRTGKHMYMRIVPAFILPV